MQKQNKNPSCQEAAAPFPSFFPLHQWGTLFKHFMLQTFCILDSSVGSSIFFFYLPVTSLSLSDHHPRFRWPFLASALCLGLRDWLI